MKIHILLCDTFPGLLPPEIPDYPSMFVNLFRPLSGAVEFEVWPALEGVLPPLPGCGAAAADKAVYLITGSNCAAYDDSVPWIPPLLEWIRRASERETPMLGICFGHQAMARALGGKVERFSGGWGAGVRESRVTEPEMSPFFPEGRMRLLCNHHDQVVKAPAGAEVLAESPFCRYEGLRYGHYGLSFQGHPEYTAAYARHLLLHHASGEDPGVVSRALASLDGAAHDGEAVARFILSFHFGNQKIFVP